MNTYNPIGILHAFDPAIFKHHQHDEVQFIEGRYLDIASKTGKDKRALYFGTSKNSSLLTGIFLGDFELTSRVKDISLLSSDDKNSIVICVKYINENNKLATIKSRLPSSVSVDSMNKNIESILTRLNTIDTSVNNIYERLNIIDSSVEIINSRLDVIDTSLSTVIEDLGSGKYNYTIHQSIGPFEEGYKKRFTLFKGDSPQADSSIIELNDFTLKKLEYNLSTNEIIATAWPDACGDSTELNIVVDTNYDGTPVYKKAAALKPEYIKATKLDMSLYDQHINDFINTDSSINDRLTFVENQLKWEDLIN